MSRGHDHDRAASMHRAAMIITASCLGLADEAASGLFARFERIQRLVGVRTVIAGKRLLMRLPAGPMRFIGSKTVGCAAVFLCLLHALVVGNISGIRHAY